MPGNDTSEARGNKSHLPVFWIREDFVKNQTTPVAMAISGYPSGMDRFQPPRKYSIRTIIVHLSEALTAGNVKFEITRDGVGDGVFLNLTSSDGTRKRNNLVPGELLFNQSEEIGIQWTTNAAHAPDSVIDGVVLIETQESS